MTAYIRTTLLSGEKVLYHSKPHPIIFVTSILWFVAAIFIYIVGSPIGIKLFNYEFNLVFSALFVLFGIYSIVSAYITYVSAEYGITNKRVLMKIGFIRRNSLEIILQRVESIHVEQSIFGRIFDYGTVIICGTGGSKDGFFYVPKPLTFRRVAQEQIEVTVEPVDEHHQ
jgi:uncharacterized membrane protein YdbT with pleckstrin-like domain